MDISEFENIKVFKNSKSELEYLTGKANSHNAFLEFGVYKGDSINMLSELIKVKWYGFDSFRGLPEKWDAGFEIMEKGHFSLKGKLPKVNDNVELIQGLFKDTIPKWKECNNQSISFINIDCDLYSSTKCILFQMNDRIIPGTILRFDELCCWRSCFNEQIPHWENLPFYKKWSEHEWKALNEWLTEFNRMVIPVSRTNFLSGTVVVTK